MTLLFSLSDFLHPPYSAGLIALIISLAITPLVILLAKKMSWVVAPRNDRWHKKPTALMGGIAIFIAYSLAIFITNGVDNNWFIYAAAALMFLTGLADDFREIKPIIKLIGQVVCAFVMVYNGFDFGGGLLEWAGIPLTFFWVIGITNALNLLDNMDGLAAGIAGIVAAIAGVLAAMNGDVFLATMAFALSGSSIGFLVYNFNPARIFMGDSGSLFLGFSISFLSVAIQKNIGSSSAILVLLIPISLMAIPIMDTTLVTVKRLIAGRKISTGGKDHSSHRLVALGFSEKKAVLVLYAISIAWGALCIFMLKSEINNLLLIVFLLAIFSFIFSLLLSKVKVYNESEEKLIYLRSRGYKIGKGNNLFLRFFLMNKKLIVGLFTDISIIYFAFFIAAKSTKTDIDNQYPLLALFICIKIGFFYLSNLYYRMWRYMAIMELGGYFVSTFSASVIIFILLLLNSTLPVYSNYFFLVDFLLTFTGVLFSRLTFRSLIEYINKNRQNKRRVLIYGAGDSGFLLVKELLQNHRYDLTPVGWIDDDEAKHKMYLYGYRIFGGEPQLLESCKKHDVQLVLISSKSINTEKEQELKEKLNDAGIEVGRFSLNLNF